MLPLFPCHFSVPCWLCFFINLRGNLKKTQTNPKTNKPAQRHLGTPQHPTASVAFGFDFSVWRCFSLLTLCFQRSLLSSFTTHSFPNMCFSAMTEVKVPPPPKSLWVADSSNSRLPNQIHSVSYYLGACEVFPSLEFEPAKKNSETGFIVDWIQLKQVLTSNDSCEGLKLELLLLPHNWGTLAGDISLQRKSLVATHIHFFQILILKN